jgi:hypothetical protein
MQRGVAVFMSFVTVLVLGVTFGSVSATPISYQVSAALADSYGGSGGHAFWLPGLEPGEDRWVFTGGTGQFLVDLDAGTASMTGRIEQIGNSSNWFNVNLNFSLLSNGTPPPNSPKLELSSSAYASNGGPVDPNTWSYWTLDAGSGLSNNTDTFDMSLVGPVAQLGIGANGKNIQFGFSSWFVLSDNGTPVYLRGGHGDINVNVTGGEPVPEPATLLLLGAGGVALSTRRRTRGKVA